MKLLDEIRKGWRIFWRRLRKQGAWVTLQWMWGRGLS
ncbi:MAG: protein phosphatase, partial [Candidatus Thermofonsia Clade 3 bacterium]